MLSFEIILLVTVAFLFGGFVKGTIGMGLPIVSLAVMAPPLGLDNAIAIMLAPIIITNTWQALAGPKFAELVKRLGTFLLAAVVGTWIGVSILAQSGDVLLAVLGLILCIYAVTYFAGYRVPPPGESEFAASPVAGGLGGILFGMTGNFMVPGVLYVQALGLDRDSLVQALGITFVTISAALAVSFLHHQLIPADAAGLSFYALVPTGIGLTLGRKYRHSISEELFIRYFFFALFLTGIYMIVRALMQI
ncbi:MAG: TSUP family transporter [Hyphomicrobiales bacterium]